MPKYRQARKAVQKANRLKAQRTRKRAKRDHTVHASSHQPRVNKPSWPSKSSGLRPAGNIGDDAGEGAIRIADDAPLLPYTRDSDDKLVRQPAHWDEQSGDYVFPGAISTVGGRRVIEVSAPDSEYLKVARDRRAQEPGSPPPNAA